MTAKQTFLNEADNMSSNKAILGKTISKTSLRKLSNMTYSEKLKARAERFGTFKSTNESKEPLSSQAVFNTTNKISTNDVDVLNRRSERFGTTASIPDNQRKINARISMYGKIELAKEEFPESGHWMNKKKSFTNRKHDYNSQQTSLINLLRQPGMIIPLN